MGGASNCLKVMLTHDRLFIRPFFPFLILGPDIDLVHSIPLTNIESVGQKSGVFLKSIRIRFRMPDGESREIDIMSKKTRQFEDALSEAIRKRK